MITSSPHAIISMNSTINLAQYKFASSCSPRPVKVQADDKFFNARAFKIPIMAEV